MEEEGTLTHATKMGQLMRSELRKMSDSLEIIGDVRGLGMFNGIELVKDRSTREPFVPFAAKGSEAEPMTGIMADAMEKGLYLSFFSNVIRLTPPLNISQDDLMHGLDILRKVLSKV